MFKKIALSILVLFTVSNSLCQIEELEKKLPSLKGREKVQALADLSYFNSSTDVNRGIEYGRKAYDEARKLKDPSMEVQILSDWSISYYNKGLYDSVLLLMRKAMPLAKQSGNDYLVAKVLNKQALAHFEKGEYTKALDENLKALNIFESQNALPQVIQTQINIGVIYEKTGNFSDAEEYYLKSLDIGKTLNDSKILVSVYGNLGVLYMKMNDFERANKMYFNCLDLIDKETELNFLCTVYQNIGVNFRYQAKIKEGLSYYLKAKTIAEKLKSKSALCPIMSNIGQCYLDLKDYERGEEFLFSSLKMARDINSYTELRNVYKGLTRLEHLKGNYAKADRYFDQYIDYQDSIYSQKNNQSLNELSVKYKTAKKEKDLINERLKTSNFKNWIWILGLLSLVILLTAFSIQIKRTSEKRRLEIQSMKDLEFERMRISRDLHDNIGAELTLITSKLDIKAATSNRKEEQTELTEIAALTREASVLLRETIWSIRQDTIKKADLLDKIEQFAMKRSHDKFNINCEIECDGSQEITSANALHIYRIAQEAINNSIKYSKATEVTVKFSENSFTVSDNGDGFDLTNYSPGYGVQNMKQRAEEMGADFAINSGLTGTTIWIMNY